MFCALARLTGSNPSNPGRCQIDQLLVRCVPPSGPRPAAVDPEEVDVIDHVPRDGPEDNPQS